MKMMKTMKTKVFFSLVAVLIATSLQAQNQNPRWGFELNGGVSMATRTLSGSKLNVGGGFEASFQYRVLEHTGLYAGWGWNKFTADESFAGTNADFEETGYVFGLQFKHPVGTSPIAWYARLGGLYNHIEVENNKGDIIHDTGHGFGFQLAGGVDIPLGKNWSLTPGVKFNSINRDLENVEAVDNLQLNYLQVRAGLVKMF